MLTNLDKGANIKMEINGHSLYNVWRGVNMKFLSANSLDKGFKNDFYLPKGRDYSLFQSDVTLRCDSLFLPDDVHPLFKIERRIKNLLHKYLVDEDLWKKEVEGLRGATNFPKSFQFQFHLSNPKLETGKGGGCLIGMTLSWVNDRWNLHVYSRVTEVTINLLADMYFIQFSIKKLIEEGDLKKIEFPRLNIIWNFALANQKRDRVPLFLLFNYGDTFVRDFMLSEPTNRWQKTVVDHFWNIFIYPEKVNWAQRKRWSLKFLEASHVDWKTMKERHSIGGI